MAISACGGEKVRFKPIPIPAERIDCVAVTKADRPKLAPTYIIDWSMVLTVPAARAEVDKLIQSTLNREGSVTGYVIELEGKLFACSSDDQWLKDYIAQVEK